MIRFLFLFCFVFNYLTKINAQINLGFVKHLSENELKSEHWTYLNQIKSSNDSVEYFKAKFHLQYGNDSLFLESFRECYDLFCSDTNAFWIANIHFLKTTNTYRDIWFDKISPDFKKYQNRPELDPLIEVYLYTQHVESVDTSQIEDVLLPDFLKFKKATKKKPILAAIFSAFVPGLGELYIGNHRSFGNKLVLLGLFGIQTAESISKLGSFHPLSIVNVGFITTFYTVNIIGSYHDTKVKKTETKNQFLINASNYYSSTFLHQLY